MRIADELDFDSVLELVAAHAGSGVGRSFVSDADEIPDRRQALENAALSRELDALLDDGGRLPLAGIDEAALWLEPGRTIPVEPEDLLILLGLARKIASIRRKLGAAPDGSLRLAALRDDLPDTDELVAWAAPLLGRDGRVGDDASPDLRQARRAIARIRQQVMAELEGIRRRHTDVVTDAPPTVRRDRYCLPVHASARHRLPGLVLDASGSGQTVYVEPFGVVDLNNDLVDAVMRERREIRRILAEIAAAFGVVRDDLAGAVRTLGFLDAAQARVLFGRTIEGLILDPGEGSRLILDGARHPLLDARLESLRRTVFGEEERKRSNSDAVPLDFSFPDGISTIVVSGPNAGGKTVVLKTIGLMVLMCYHGIPISVEPGSSIPWFDHIWCRIGDDQTIAADLSTFSGAMATTAELLEAAGPRSLVIYDELGSGTDPLEGAALGCAILEELTSRGCRTVATTHLAAIALAASSADGMDNAAMHFDEDEGRPTYRLRMGRPGRSRGLEIAETMGLPETVIERARVLLGGQHLELDRWLERLETLEAELLSERRTIERERADLSIARARLEQERRRLEADRAALPDRLEEERGRLRDRAKKRLDRALARLDRAEEERRHLGRRMRQKIRDEALDLSDENSLDPPVSEANLEPGMRVRVRSLGAEGVLQDVRSGQVRVAVAGKRFWVSRSDVEPIERRTETPVKRPAVAVDVGDREPEELVLLGLDAEEARERVERYLDRAHAGGVRSVRIVHGHGTGVLKRVVAEIVSTHPGVVSYGHPPGNRGGTGATEVLFEE